MKYILELKPEYEDKFKGLMILGAKDSNLFVDTIAVENLEELNSDYISKHFSDLKEDAYQRGLEDAWEAARKIADMWETMDNDDLLETFGVTAKIGESVIGTLFKKQTANEAMLELEAYEEKQTDDEIKVGDEVEHSVECFVVTVMNDEYVFGISKDGTWCYASIKNVRKTGRHFDISSILKEMQS